MPREMTYILAIFTIIITSISVCVYMYLSLRKAMSVHGVLKDAIVRESCHREVAKNVLEKSSMEMLSLLGEIRNIDSSIDPKIKKVLQKIEIVAQLGAQFVEVEGTNIRFPIGVLPLAELFKPTDRIEIPEHLNAHVRVPLVLTRIAVSNIVTALRALAQKGIRSTITIENRVVQVEIVGKYKINASDLLSNFHAYVSNEMLQSICISAGPIPYGYSFTLREVPPEVPLATAEDSLFYMSASIQ